jgi:hypothetical protein
MCLHTAYCPPALMTMFPSMLPIYIQFFLLSVSFTPPLNLNLCPTRLSPVSPGWGGRTVHKVFETKTGTSLSPLRSLLRLQQRLLLRCGEVAVLRREHRPLFKPGRGEPDFQLPLRHRRRGGRGAEGAEGTSRRDEEAHSSKVL